MDLHIGLKKVLLATCIALGGAGCAMSETRAPHEADTRNPGVVADASSTASDSAAATVGALEGDWYYGSDCDFGHYVTLGIKRSGAEIVGDWSDGTRVRGSQGQLKGALRNGELAVQFCDEGGEIGGQPQCPDFDAARDSFVREGDTLVWYRTNNGERTRYVMLRPASQKADLRAECREDADKEGAE